MAEITQVQYTHKELLALMLKDQGIHEGIWALMVGFGLGVANVGPSDNEVNPAAIIPLLHVGLQKGTLLNNITVDAAEVNPRQKTKNTESGTKKPR